MKDKPRQVFLITVDCLRADFVGCTTGRTRYTPNIDRFAEDSVVFARAFANGPGTNQSFPAILSSTYFLMHGGLRLLPRSTTLAEVLSNNGFKTVAFHSNPFLSKRLGWSRGFSEFHDFMDILKAPSAFVARRQGKGSLNKLANFTSAILGANRSAAFQRLLMKIYYKFSSLQIPYLDGKQLNKVVIDWIERNQNERVFVWIHYMDPHSPYVPPEGYLSNFSSREEAFHFSLSVDHKKPSNSELQTLRNLYTDEVRYVDACIGELIRFLESKSVSENSLIALTADHGHAFMEHGRFAHAYDILYNEVLHIPLILHGVGFAKTVTAPVQLLDVPPTITSAIGAKKPASFMGEDLMHIALGGKPSLPIFSESARPDLINLKYDLRKQVISCIVDKHKAIVNELSGTAELYDIEKDFEEKTNVIEDLENVYDQLHSKIEKHLEDVSVYRRMRGIGLKRHHCGDVQ